ncbi:hypothetical protein HAX54_017994, partial [Datura stramonium]|nr:hypothetical protein [Datura stramonium]
ICRPPERPQWRAPAPQGFCPQQQNFQTPCEYHSNTQGHITENYWTFKRIIENLIDDKAIVIHNEETTNITNNPLPAHNNA